MTARKMDSEPFNSVDAAWYHMDTPTNLAVINGVVTFEGKIDFERLKATLVNRFLIHRRFRQRVCKIPGPFGIPRWEYDPDFDLDWHLKRISLPEPGDQNALQDLVGEMMSQPLDPSKPLWKFYFVDEFQGNCALICRFHHCIADGLAMVQVLLSTADLTADAPAWPLAVEPPRKELSPLARALVPAVKAVMTMRETYQDAKNLVHEGIELLVDPIGLMNAAILGRNKARALGKLLIIPPDQQTILRGKNGIAKRVTWSKTIPLQDVKEIGQIMGGTVNDILITALSGALRRYLEERGEPVDGLNIRAIIPVNLRPPGKIDPIGNHFGMVYLSLPISIQDPIKRLIVLRQRMNALKDSPEADVSVGILRMAGMSPKQIEDIIVRIFGMKSSLVVTNVPGPQVPLFLAGKKISNIMFWVPMPGNLALGVSIISYNGEVFTGITTDEGLLPDPEKILSEFHCEFEELKKWGRSSKGGTSEKIIYKSTSKPKTNRLLINSSGQDHTSSKSMDAKSSTQCQALTKAGAQCKNRTVPGSKYCHIHNHALEEAENIR